MIDADGEQPPSIRNLMRKNNHPFSQAIWDARLQAAWIVFAGRYAISGALLKGSIFLRLTSSAFLTAASLLVFLLVCHTVVVVDRAASRKTLLVALAACLFIAQKSVDTYSDQNGVLFALLFSCAIFILIWIAEILWQD
jgi:hypothetical protein